MSAVERLQAAIEKLESVRAASTQPTGGKAWIQGRPERFRFENTNEVYSGEEAVHESQDIVYGLPEAADAELICLLHRTIDAQLAILRFGVQRQTAVDWTRRLAGDKHVEAATNELALADAILGGTQ